VQTRGVCPELSAPFSTPVTPPAEPSLVDLQQALADRDAEIARLCTLVNALRQRMLLMEVALINTLPHASLPEG
jgi:hypothetical protein